MFTEEHGDFIRANPSYDPQACCGRHCYMRGRPDEPCWGPVVPVDWSRYEEGEDWVVHACQGHKPVYDGGDYTPEPEAGEE